MRVRASRVEDLGRLAAVERSASRLFAGTPLEWALLAPPVPAALVAEAHRRGLAWVAEQPPEIAGFLLASAFGRSLFLEELSVAQPFQRRGAGTRLLRTALRHAARAGFDSVTLTTDRALPWNRPFYEREGFVVLDADALPGFIAQRLPEEYAGGHDPARRCAMWRGTDQAVAT